MINFAYDDGGRAAAGFKGTTGDCVVRAISIALQAEDYASSAATYREVYDEMAAAMKQHGYAASGNAYSVRVPQGWKTQEGPASV